MKFDHEKDRGRERELRMRCACTIYRNDVIYGRDMSKLFSWTVTSIDSNWILTMERILLRGKWNGDWSNIEILYRSWFRWNNSMSNIDDHVVYLCFIRSWRNMQKIFASYTLFSFYNDIKLKRHIKI